MGIDVDYHTFARHQTEHDPFQVRRPWHGSASWSVELVMRKLLGLRLDEDQFRKRFRPSVFASAVHLMLRRPSAVILRDFTIRSGLIYLACKMARIPKVLIYSQLGNEGALSAEIDVSKGTLWRRIYRKLFSSLGFFSLRVVSPIYLPMLTHEKSDYFLHQSQISFLPFVVERPEILPPVNKQDKLLILSVAKFRPYKGHGILLSALEKLEHSNLKKVQLTLVGTVSSISEKIYLNGIRNLVAQRLPQISLKVLLNVRFDAMTRIYSQNEIFVLPSSDDVAAIAPLEAMAHGLTTICFRGNGTSGYIESEANGFVVEDNNVQALSEVLALVACNPELRSHIGERARLSVGQLCSEDRFQMLASELFASEDRIGASSER